MSAASVVVGKKSRENNTLDWIKSVQSACIMQPLEFLFMYVRTMEMGIPNEPNSELFFFHIFPCVTACSSKLACGSPLDRNHHSH